MATYVDNLGLVENMEMLGGRESASQNLMNLQIDVSCL
jgi:hypothetical protein